MRVRGGGYACACARVRVYKYIKTHIYNPPILPLIPRICPLVTNIETRPLLEEAKPVGRQRRLGPENAAPTRGGSMLYNSVLLLSLLSIL
jgi:hypothetical protein